MIYTLFIIKVLHFNMEDLKNRSFIVRTTNGVVSRDIYHLLIKGKSIRSNRANFKKVAREIRKSGGKVEVINYLSR